MWNAYCDDTRVCFGFLKVLKKKKKKLCFESTLYVSCFHKDHDLSTLWVVVVVDGCTRTGFDLLLYEKFLKNTRLLWWQAPAIPFCTFFVATRTFCLCVLCGGGGTLEGYDYYTTTIYMFASIVTTVSFIDDRIIISTLVGVCFLFAWN